MSKILLKNATLVCPSSIIRKDLLIEDDKIAKIDRDISDAQAKVIDCKEHLVMPGLIDAHVHFREPGMDKKGTIASESRAAVLGGVTSYMDMPNTNPPTLSYRRVQEKKAIAARNSLANYAFYLGASTDNLEDIKKAPVNDIAGIKVYMGSTTGNLLVDDQNYLYKLFDQSPCIIAAHCEDNSIIARHYAIYKERYGDKIPIVAHSSIRSRDCCYESSKLAIELALATKAKLHIMHISTRDELELLKPHANNTVRDRPISAEACIPHLYFSDSDFINLGGYIKCNPAVKREYDRLAIARAVAQGILTTVGTDHAPHERELKELKNYDKCPSGIPSVQFSLLVLLELFTRHEISLEDVVRASSYNVAQRFDIKGRGAIEEGNYADLVVASLTDNTVVRQEDIASKCGFSPFTGHRFTSKILHTIVSGRHVVENGRIIDETPGQALEFDRS